MTNKIEEVYRECEECGEPIESGKPGANLCKRCAAAFQTKRRRAPLRQRPKDQKKKKKKRRRDFEEEEEYYYEDELR